MFNKIALIATIVVAASAANLERRRKYSHETKNCNKWCVKGHMDNYHNLPKHM